MINCSGWPYEEGRPLGTPMHLAHLSCHTCALTITRRSLRRGRVVLWPVAQFRSPHRAPLRNTYSAGIMANGNGSKEAPLRLNFMENTLGFELNPAVTINTQKVS